MQLIFPYSKKLLITTMILSSFYGAYASSKVLVEKLEPVTPRSLNLKTIVKLALKNSPRLKSAQSTIEASEGKHTQAGLYPNPDISFQAENIGGNASSGGAQTAEITYGVSQVIEVGGKRSERKEITQQDLEFSRYTEMLEAIEVIYEATVSYANAAAAQEMLKLSVEQKKIAEDLFKEVSNRVKAAREPHIQMSKAQITLSTATFSYEKALRNLSQAKTIISNFWGEQESNFAIENKDFFKLMLPLTKDQVKKQIEDNIYFKRMKTAQTRAEAQYNLENANLLPDPRINVAKREFRNTGQHAWVMGVSIPIPLFNQNQGNIKQALHEISKAKLDIRKAHLELINAGYKALGEQINAYKKAENFKAFILPSAESAFFLAFEGYREGKFPYIEVLDALRTLFEVKEQYLSTLRDYHIASAEIKRLTVKNVKYDKL